MQHPIPLVELPEQLHKFCDPDGPAPARMMAAKGLVPLKPEDLITVLYQLCHDPDEKVRDAALAKARELPENIVDGALAGELDSRVLDFYAVKLVSNASFINTIILNQQTADETIARIARGANEAVTELIATNQQRLLQHPAIIEALYHNRSALMSTVNRAVELAIRHGIVLDGIPSYKELAAAIQGELIIEEDGPCPADAAFNQTLSFGEALEKEIGDEAIEETIKDEESAQKQQNLQFYVGKMTASEKIRMALLGTAAHRSLLVRDSNRVVAMAAIKCPAVTENEVDAYTRNRSLPEDVIRYIANSREMTKSYRVKRNLVENPKTPLPKAMTFLSHMRQHDLRSIGMSKNVPQAIAAAARQQLQKRG